jgi:hypothetical protein
MSNAFRAAFVRREALLIRAEVKGPGWAGQLAGEAGEDARPGGEGVVVAADHPGFAGK